MNELKKGQIIFYAQIFRPPIDEYNIIELKVNTIREEKGYFTGCETGGNKHTYLFHMTSLGKTVFLDRMDALVKVNEAEEKYRINKEIRNGETN